MTNFEKYKDEILKSFAYREVCAFKQEIIYNSENCMHFDCDWCGEYTRRWLNEEYKIPDDWSKVPIDTPIWVWNEDDESDKTKRYFAKYESGKIYAWANGATSWSAENENYREFWHNAELVNKDEL